MVTNNKEYMREYQRARRAKIKKDVKNVKNIVKNLHLPKMVETSVPVRIEGGSRTAHPSNLERVATTDSKTIDFSYLTNNSSFQRAIMEFIRRFVPGLENIKVRGNKEVLKQSFNANANNYRNVIKELKQVWEAKKNEG